MSIYHRDPSEAAGDGSLSRVSSTARAAVGEPQQTLKRMIVIDVISDPSIIDDNKIDYWTNVLKVSNIKFAKKLARNSIIAQNVAVSTTRITPVMFLLPFFPSHLAFPCKPGEMVWTIFENPNARTKDMGYWMCRISEPHFIDDVNHTHHAAQLDQSNERSIKDVFEQKNKRVYQLDNGAAYNLDGVRTTPSDSNLLSDPDGEIFEKIIENSDASKMISYESVPRFKKRPGDVVLEGSNNSLIVLGTDRIDSIADYDFTKSLPVLGIVPEILEGYVSNAGSIDLVAGRGTTSVTGGAPVEVKGSLYGEEIKKEIGKSDDEISPFEGDIDNINDRSRILISQRTNVDRNFNLSKYIEKRTNIRDSGGGDAGIVIKSDKIRIIARSDISFLVSNFTNGIGTDNKSFSADNNDMSKWASITIRSNGDIIFTPSAEGVIKLGGDDADRAILCTANAATNATGLIAALPIATTAGGFVGTAKDKNGKQNVDIQATTLSAEPDLGTFSKKVLIK